MVREKVFLEKKKNCNEGNNAKGKCVIKENKEIVVTGEDNSFLGNCVFEEKQKLW